MDPSTPLQPYTPAAPVGGLQPATPAPAYMGTTSTPDPVYAGAPASPAPAMDPNQLQPSPYQPVAPQMPYAPIAASPAVNTPPVEQPGDPRSELIEKLRSSNNVLVTVNSNQQ